MGKALFIAEKPSVAQEFAKALKVSGRKGDGYIESDQAIVTWCVGHLVTMNAGAWKPCRFSRRHSNTR